MIVGTADQSLQELFGSEKSMAQIGRLTRSDETLCARA